MTEKKFPMEGVDGRVIAPGDANSLTGANQQANGTWSFAADAALEGGTGLKAIVASATTTISRFTPSASNVQMSIGTAMRIDQLPTKTFHAFASLRNSVGPAMRVLLGADGRLALRGSGTSAPEVAATGTLTPTKMYWMSLIASATAGTASLRFYEASTRALAASIEATAGALSFNGTGVFSALDLGWINSDPNTGHVCAFDSLVIDDGSTAEKKPASWSAPASLVGSMYDGSAVQPGAFRTYDGSGLQELASVSVAP